MRYFPDAIQIFVFRINGESIAPGELISKDIVPEYMEAR